MEDRMLAGIDDYIFKRAEALMIHPMANAVTLTI